MRFRVDMRYGYISFDEADEDRARDLYAREGIRLRRCTDIYDTGEVIEGLPIGIDFEKQQAVN